VVRISFVGGRSFLRFSSELFLVEPWGGGGGGGESTYEGDGDACRKFSVKPLKKRPRLNTNNSQGINVIENFDNMNQVKKKELKRYILNTHFCTPPRATLKDLHS